MDQPGPTHEETILQQHHHQLTQQAAIIQQLQQQIESMRVSVPRHSSLKIQPPDTYHGNADTTGHKATLWMAALEVYFDANQVTRDDDRVRLAALHLRGSAAVWWAELLQHNTRPSTWEQFKLDLRARFSAADAEEATRAALNKLHQIGSAQAYATLFMNTAAMAPSIADNELKAIYMRGLKPQVKLFTAQREPATLQEAVKASANVDHHINSSQPRQSTNSRPGPGQRSYQPQRPSWSNHSNQHQDSVPMELGAVTTSPLPKLSEAERERLLRTGGCFRCRQQGHLASHCPAFPAAAAHIGRGGERRHPSGSGAAPNRR